MEAEGEEELGFSAPIEVEAWQRLMLEGELQLGGVRRSKASTSPAPTTPSVGAVPTDAPTSSTALVSYCSIE